MATSTMPNTLSWTGPPAHRPEACVAWMHHSLRRERGEPRLRPPTPGCQPAGTTAALLDTSPWASLLTVGNTWGIVCIRSIRRRGSTRYSTMLTYWGTRLSRLRLGTSGSHYLLAGPSGSRG